MIVAVEVVSGSSSRSNNCTYNGGVYSNRSSSSSSSSIIIKMYGFRGKSIKFGGLEIIIIIEIRRDVARRRAINRNAGCTYNTVHVHVILVVEVE